MENEPFKMLPAGYGALPTVPGYYDEDAEECVQANPADEVIPVIDSIVDEPPDPTEEKSETSSGSRAWLVHKTAKQALWRPMFATAFVPRANMMYRTYSSRFAVNPNDELFNDTMTMIYRPQNISTKMLKRMFIPAKYRHADLSKEEAEALRTSGAAQGRLMSRIMISANVARIIGNSAAIADCVAGQGCAPSEAAVIGSDTANTLSFIGVQKFYSKGFNHIKSAQKALDAGDAAAHEARQMQAFKAFDVGKRISYASFALQAISGSIKVGIEIDHFIDDPESARFSALGDGAVDIGQGAAYSYYNYYLVSRAANTARLGNLAGIKAGTDVLSANAMVIPARILWPMRGLGVAGGVIQFIPNAIMAYNGASDDTLSYEASRHMMISGSLGMASAIFMTAGCLLITPASLPLGVIAMGIGIALIATQTFYDEWDDWQELMAPDDPEIFENSLLYIEPPVEVPVRREPVMIPMTPVS